MKRKVVSSNAVAPVEKRLAGDKVDSQPGSDDSCNQDEGAPMAKANRRTLRFVELFAGIGGFRVALERLGMRCVYSCEIEGQARATYRLNWPEPTAKSLSRRSAKQHSKDCGEQRKRQSQGQVPCAGQVRQQG